jgi:acetoin utilization protein AcuB
MRLKEIMSIPVEVIAPDTSVADARARMARARIHHLLVASGHEIAGIVSERDLEGAAPEAPVQPLMSRPVITAPADTTVADAAKLLRSHDVGCLPVMEGGRPIGMVTIVDLLTLLGKGAIHINPETGRRVLSRRGPAAAH